MELSSGEWLEMPFAPITVSETYHTGAESGGPMQASRDGLRDSSVEVASYPCSDCSIGPDGTLFLLFDGM